MLSYRYALSLALCFSLPFSLGGWAVAESADFSPLHGFAPVTDTDQEDNARAIEPTEFLLSQGQVPTPPLQPLPSEDDVEIPPTP
ncbi:ShlB/FhaC/HecB family hemolysin secretion/activation protein, partial [Synechocystis salina LEGE 00041]|nr:ShlB/FhaC/HecB family hemolysin secretion/activation protein [Synechocystis salina LEGE 00041]